MATKFYKDGIGLNDEVTVTIPAVLIIAAITSYQAVEWVSDPINILLSKCQREILDQVYVNEQEAAHQEMHDQANTIGEGLMHIFQQQQQDPRAQDPRFDQDSSE